MNKEESVINLLNEKDNWKKLAEKRKAILNDIRCSFICVGADTYK